MFFWNDLDFRFLESDLILKTMPVCLNEQHIAQCLSNNCFEKSGSMLYLATSQIFKLLPRTLSKFFHLSCMLVWRYFDPIAYTKLFQVLHLNETDVRTKYPKIHRFLFEPVCGGFTAALWIGVLLYRTQRTCFQRTRS